MKKQLRIHKSALYHSAGKYHYNGILFSGVMYDEVEDSDEIFSYQVDNGKIISDYSNEWMDQLSDDPRSFVEPPGAKPQAHYEGQPLSGRIHHFEQGYCVSEEMFYQGMPMLKMTWYTDGGVSLYERHIGKIRAMFTFHENATINYVQFDEFDTQTDLLVLGISEDNSLSTLNLSKVYSTVFNKIVPELPFPNPATFEVLTDYVFADHVELSGNALNKDFYTQILSKKCLQWTSILSIKVESMEQSQLKEIGCLPALKKLHIEDSVGNLSSDLIQLKKQRPDLQIKYHFVLE